MSAERERLAAVVGSGTGWKQWGPYLSERQWGTVREDYSENGDAWNYFSHDHARSRAYRWGEDGLAGISDDRQRLCFALALWNGKDPILKERLFGLTNSEGNHGEDVKEYYFYLDSTPTHSYMKYLYKYPQAAYPYADLVETNRRRTRDEMEYELLDTGVFEEDRYFDVFVEYAKGSPEDILVQITAANRGPEAAELHVLPTLWFRNDWASWVATTVREADAHADRGAGGHERDRGGASGPGRILPVLSTARCHCSSPRTRPTTPGSFPSYPNASPYVKDGINDYVVQGHQEAVNPGRRGTKAAAHYRLMIGPGQSATVRLRLTDRAPAGQREHTAGAGWPLAQDFDETLAARVQEADEFYRSVTPPSVSPDAANVMRQAIAGMLWSKQYYYLDADQWLEEHQAHPLHPGSRHFRNREWFHMINEDIISMPDKWEYPWYAAWDLAFHTLPISIVDPDFAKQQIELMLRGQYLHPSGQLPAYEWNFSDVNPPVHAWATLFLYRTEQALHGEGDLDFLRSAFNKLALNFTWWVNRKDRFGKNVFEGGFLGLDNIGVFDRSAPLPTGRLPGAGGRHGVDGPVHAEHGRAGRRARRPRPHLRGHGLQVRGAFLLHRRGHEPARWGRDVGRGGRLLLRPAPPPRWPRHAAQGALDGGAPAPVRHDGDREVAARARPANDGRVHGAHAPDARAREVHPPHGAGPPGSGRARDPGAGQPGAAPPDPLEDAGRGRVPEPLWHPLTLEVPRAAPLRFPGRRPGVPGRLPAGGVEHWHVRRKLQLAGADLVPGECPHHPGAPAVLPVLR